jgi:DHA1 family multidrug resistance protein-like MFS transporter
MQRTWRRNLRAVWAGELLAIMGFAAFGPILPYYVEYLGVTGDAVATWAGVTSALPSLAMAIMGPIWGALSDRHGRKVMVERAMFGGCALTLLMSFVQSVEQLAVLRFIQGGLTGTVAASTTLVAGMTPEDRLGETLGKLQLAIFLGVTVGPLFGGFAADTFGYRAVFWMTSVFLLIGGLIILLGVKEDFEPVPVEEREPFWRNIGSDLNFAFTQSLLGLVLMVHFAMRVGRRFPTPILPLFVEELLPGSETLGSASGLLTTIIGGAGAISSPLLGRFADRYGGRPVLLACTLVGGAALIGQGMAGSYTMLLITQVLLGLVIGGILATVSAYVGRAVPQERSGMAYGLDTTAVALANSAGPFVGGWLARWFTLRTPFLMGGVLMLLASAGVLRLPRKSPDETE